MGSLWLTLSHFRLLFEEMGQTEGTTNLYTGVQKFFLDEVPSESEVVVMPSGVVRNKVTTQERSLNLAAVI